MLMPLTYSIAYGIIGGFLCWIALQIIFYSLSLVGIKLPYDSVEAVPIHPIDAAQKTAEVHGYDEGSRKASEAA
jgi:xanthine/uracil/vitamin C permease (AzgA family)